jgi:hypothetical protein
MCGEHRLWGRRSSGDERVHVSAQAILRQVRVASGTGGRDCVRPALHLIVKIVIP